ncbi:MAG: enoyl-CoA hydratase-related protein [Acidimicrobiales bacterium]
MSDAPAVVSLERQGRIAVVTLHRAEKRNAVNPEVTAGLDAAFNEIEDDPEIWVAVLTGGPEVFCAGTDLTGGAGENTERGGEYGLMRRRRTTPLIAAVEGLAMGGGFELTLASDLVVASRGTVFALPEVAKGVIANARALFRAVRHLPRNIAKEMLLTGQGLSAERAAELGYVNRLTEPGRRCRSLWSWLS